MAPYVENWEIYQCFAKLPAYDVPEVVVQEGEEDGWIPR